MVTEKYRPFINATAPSDELRGLFYVHEKEFAMGQVLAVILVLALTIAALRLAIIAGVIVCLIVHPKPTLLVIMVFGAIPAAFGYNILLGIVVTIFTAMCFYTVANHAED